MSQKKILIVEDDVMIRSMYEVKLKQEGYNTITADNGSQAIDLAIKERPDIILLDIILPQVDGFTVLQKIRASDSIKDIPVLVLTNLGTEEDRQKGERFGATEYFVKASLTPAQVGEKIKEVIG